MYIYVYDLLWDPNAFFLIFLAAVIKEQRHFCIKKDRVPLHGLAKLQVGGVFVFVVVHWSCL